MLGLKWIFFTWWYRLWLRFLGVSINQNVKFMGAVSLFQFRGKGIKISDRVVLGGHMDSNPINTGKGIKLSLISDGSIITIGADSGLSECCISSNSIVSIGERVLIGAGALIIDSDFHIVDIKERRYNPNCENIESKPICIHDDVWIGANCTILKGVNIGTGSVIAAGSIVTRDIPAGVLAAGVPAKVIKKIKYRSLN